MDLERCQLRASLVKRKTVVVVGAGSSIGEVLVPALPKEFDTLVLTETSENYPKLVERYKELAEQGNVYFLILDVRNEAHIKAMELFVEEKELVIESLIYLAGLNILAPALQVTREYWDMVLDVNLKGFFFLAQGVAKNMILNGGGSIVGIASQHGVVGNVDRAPYCAAKAGLIHLAKELALEWARYEIRVNMVSPTMILSDKNREVLEGARAKKEYLSKIPLKKYAIPEDISEAVLFLNSDRAAMITGQNLVVDGGWTIC